MNSLALPKKTKSNLPYHIGVIMDGNRRWAKKNGLAIDQGHRAGLKTLKMVAQICQDIGIPILSAFAFSSQNWKRDPKEIKNLFNLFEELFSEYLDDIHQSGIRIIHSGHAQALPDKVKKTIETMCKKTKDNTKGILNIAVNYGGQQEIIFAINQMLDEFRQSNKPYPPNITIEQFERYLYHPDLPFPNLIIRTSGEKRLSNFLLWQSAYTDLHFIKTLWPDLSKNDILMAIDSYQQSEHFYGG